MKTFDAIIIGAGQAGPALAGRLSKAGMLARAVARRSQTAVRLAIGASRRQIVGQALIESILLALIGGAAGLLIAAGAVRLLLSLAFRSARFLPINTEPSLLVLGFTFTIALVTGVVFGAAPAWFATRTDPVDALRGAGRSTSDHSSFTRKALLVVQATLSVVLVAGATMLGRSLNKLENQDFGYQVQNRVVVSLNSPPATYTQDQLRSLYRQLEERLTRIPGVQGAGLALYNPLTDNWGELIFVDGHPPAKMSEESGSSWDRVSANYLQNFGIQVVKGRAFTAADNEHSDLVAVVNEAFVKRFFKSGEDPIDQHFGLDMVFAHRRPARSHEEPVTVMVAAVEMRRRRARSMPVAALATARRDRTARVPAEL